MRSRWRRQQTRHSHSLPSSRCKFPRQVLHALAWKSPCFLMVCVLHQGSCVCVLRTCWTISRGLDCERFFLLCLFLFSLKLHYYWLYWYKSLSFHTLHAPKSKVHESSTRVHEAALQHVWAVHMGLCWFRLLAIVLLAWRVSHPSSYQFAVWKLLGFFYVVRFFSIWEGFLPFFNLGEVIPRWSCWINMFLKDEMSF